MSLNGVNLYLDIYTHIYIARKIPKDKAEWMEGNHNYIYCLIQLMTLQMLVQNCALELNKVSCISFQGRLRKLKPKQRREFLKGYVLRWEDFVTTEGSFSHKKNRVPVLSSFEQNSDKERVIANTTLKVYSRVRTKKPSKNILDLELNHTVMDEVHEGLE